MRGLICLFLLSLISHFFAKAQVSQNMALRTQWDESTLPTSSGVRYNDIWGYVDCDGNEYGIVGSARYTHFFNVTDPDNIIEVDRFEGTVNSIWRDYKTYGSYAYGVADQGNEGLAIFNLTQLPNSVSRVSLDNSDFGQAHNIFIDEANARLYVAGSDTRGNGLLVYDLSVNPADPTMIANVSLASGGGYVHDVYVRDNIAYCSHGWNGYYIWDFTDAQNPSILASTPTNGYNHSSWLTDDGTWAVVAEEVPRGLPLLMINLSDLASGNISVDKTFKEPLLAPTHVNNTPHNPFIRGNHIICSYYEDGVQVFDISDPLNPTRVAYYDTNPNNTQYNGTTNNWGTYPYLPSGTILATDTRNGFFVLSATGFSFAEISSGTPDVTLNEFGSTEICMGESFDLSIPFGATSYQWFKDGQQIPNATNSSLSLTEAGNYTVEASRGNCTATSSNFELIVNPIPVAEIDTSGTINLCDGETTIISSTVNADSYQWYDGNIPIGGATNPTLEIPVSSNISLKVTTNECTSTSAAVEIIVQDNPTLSLDQSGTIELCEGAITTINASSDAASFQWFNEGNPIMGATTSSITIAEEGNYVLEATTNNCTTTSSVVSIQVQNNPSISLNQSGTIELCENESITITASTTGTNFQWFENGIAIDGANSSALTTSNAGNYSLETSLNGCFGISDVVTIIVNENPTAEINYVGLNEICAGENIIVTSSSIADSYQWLEDGNPIQGASNNSITLDASGNYSLQTNSNGCTATSFQLNLVVNEISSPTLNTANTIKLCEGESFQLSTNDDADSYQWLLNGDPINGATTVNFDAVQEGNYSLEITENNCVAISEEVEIISLDLPNASINAPNSIEICDGESYMLSAMPNAGSYQWYQDGILINGATNATFSANSSGNYTLEVINNNCSAISQNVTVVINNLPEAIINAPNEVELCEGESFTLSSTNVADSYQWFQNGMPINGATNASFTTNSSGSYSVEAIQNNCAARSQNVTIVINNLPDAIINAPNEISLCEGENFQLISNSNADTYQWYQDGMPINDATASSYTAEITGNYTLETTLNNCIATSQVINIAINDNPVSVIDAPNSIELCEGESFTLFSTNMADSYQWFQNGMPINDATNSSFEAISSGNYSVELIQNNCVATSQNVEIIINDNPEANIDAETNITLCEEETFTLSTSSTAQMYQWYLNEMPINGATNSSYNASSSGTYTLETSSNNCTTRSENINITINNTPTVSIDAPSLIDLCEGESFTLMSNDVADAYQWFVNGMPINNETSNTLQIENAGLYTLEINLNNCTAISSPVEIMVSTLADATINAPAQIELCEGESYSLSTIEGADTYQWFLDGEAIPNSSFDIFNVTLSGIYSVEVTSNNCTSSSQIINVVVNDTTEVIISASQEVICQGETSTLSANTNADTYQWFNNGMPIDGATSSTFDAITDGNYNVAVNLNNCTTNSQAIEITVSIPLEVSIDADRIIELCEGETFTFSTNSNADAYQWYNNNEIIAGETGNSIIVNETGNYFLEVSDGICVSRSEEFEVIVHPLPVVTFETDQVVEICQGQSLIISTALEADAYQWYKNGQLIPDEITSSISLNEEGMYALEATINGCTDISESIELIINPIPLATFTSPSEPVVYLCEGDSVDLVGIMGSDTYQWMNNGEILEETSNSLTVNAAGTYNFMATLNGCSKISNDIIVEIIDLPDPTITALGPTTFCEGESVTLEVVDGFTYQWKINDSFITDIGNSYEAIQSGTYYVTISNAGCEVSSPEGLTVTVIEPIIPTITLDGPAMTSSNAISYQWYFNNLIIPGATNVNYTATLSGNYYVITTDPNGCEASSEVVSVDLTNVNELYNYQNIQIFPNPTAGNLMIHLERPFSNDILELRLLNTLGQLIKRENHSNFSTQQIQWDLSDLPKGIYFIEMEENGKRAIERIVLQ